MTSPCFQVMLWAYYEGIVVAVALVDHLLFGGSNKAAVVATGKSKGQ